MSTKGKIILLLATLLTIWNLLGCRTLTPEENARMDEIIEGIHEPKVPEVQPELFLKGFKSGLNIDFATGVLCMVNENDAVKCLKEYKENKSNG